MTTPRAIKMSTRMRLALSLGLTLLLWAVFAWPLPLHLADGIPSSSANVEIGGPRRMIPGDHIQLLFNYWMFGDMLAGNIPFGVHPYEFNEGREYEERLEAHIGNVMDQPFALIFTLGYWVFNRAFGWNLVGIVSLWLTVLFTWLLVRRHVSCEWTAALAAAVSIAFPFRWASLLGGSPTGYAILWVPVLFWGLDVAIRDRRIAGGFAAAIAVLLCYWNDGHIFFFSILSIPCWGLLVLLTSEDIEWFDFRRWGRRIVACLPLLAAGLCLAAMVYAKKSAEFAGTTLEGGRSWREVALYSPHPEGLFAWRNFGNDAQIYIGFLLPAVLLAGLAALTWDFLRRPRAAWRRTALLIALLAGGALLIALALGTRGPAEGRVLSLVRRLLPPYAMIRQTAKIYSFLPTVAALALGLSFAAFSDLLRPPKRARLLCGLLTLGLLLDYNAQVRPTICLLDDEQAAYAAIASDAASRSVAPHALIVSFWPGDSAWASLYEHYISLHGIRMVNGYRPVVPQSYLDDVYTRFESVNLGLLSDEQLDNLLERGVDYILVHEDAFPEKVSYFPVALTLKRLLNHPRLERLAQDRNVWAFRILSQPAPRPPLLDRWNIFFPNKLVEFAWNPPENAGLHEDPAAAGGRFVRLSAGNAIAIGPFEHLDAPSATALIRLRGKGVLLVDSSFDSLAPDRRTIAFDHDSWQWFELPLPLAPATRWATVALSLEEGQADLDLFIYASGALPALAPGESVTLPAPLFFHAGYTDLASDSVIVRADSQPADSIFYGPKLPLPEGEYRAELLFETSAPPDARLGALRADLYGQTVAEVPVVAGQPARLDFSTRGRNLPLTLFFAYSRAADVALRAVTLERLPETNEP